MNRAFFTNHLPDFPVGAWCFRPGIGVPERTALRYSRISNTRGRFDEKFHAPTKFRVPGGRIPQASPTLTVMPTAVSADGSRIYRDSACNHWVIAQLAHRAALRWNAHKINGGVWRGVARCSYRIVGQPSDTRYGLDGGELVRRLA